MGTLPGSGWSTTSLRDRLISSRIAWEKNAIERYEDAEEIWGNAYKELTKRREEWISEVRNQMLNGDELWEKRIADTYTVRRKPSC